MLQRATAFRWAISLFCCWFTVTTSFAQTTPPFSLTTDPRDTLGRQREADERRMIDPALGRVPYERLAQERERILSEQKMNGPGGGIANAAIPGMTWQERGPSNAGGVTRAVLFDPNDPTRKKVWVGSSSGGLWYTNDITDASATWTPVSDNWESMMVTCLAADPSNPQVMYAGTGDAYQYTTGGGIWKTTNGGTTWARLTSTIPGTFYGTLAASFGYIQRLVVSSTGQVFAANRYGVVRSADGGATWQYALAPTQAIGITGSPTNNYQQDFVSDLEIGTDGIVYAAFNPSRVFRANSTAGTAWTEITPAGVPTGGERTELALAPSTSGAGQVVYAASRGYNSVNYVQDIKWFRKTADAGTTWTSVVVPTHSGGGHFTSGNGNSAMSLVSDPLNANILYAGGYDWFRSVDGGTTWSSRLTTTYAYQHGLAFQPGSPANAALLSERGVNWSTGWGDAVVSNTPVLLNRNGGYRIANVTSAAMKSAPGSAYLLSTSNSFGLSTISNAGLSTGNSFFSSTDNAGRTFIDEDTPTRQLYSSFSGWYRFDGSNNTYLFGLSGWYSSNPAAYDSQNDVLYVAESINNGATVRRATNLYSTPVSTTFAIAGYPLCMQLSNDRNSLFVGFQGSLVVKYTNLSQPTPTTSTVASSAVLPTYLEISSIDVGATDNELLLTVSNYGVSSVWYTNNGGATWVNKDAAGSGLPDIPVQTALFNPQNRQQVILGTDLGIWTTNDLTAANPGWTLSNTNMPLVKVNQLRYRASDGRLIAATAGRGIFETNALAVPYTPSSVSITSVSNTTLCAGSTFAVLFTTAGPAFANAGTFEVWASDSSGNFTSQRKIGTGTSSPVSVTLPVGLNALRYGVGYRLRIVAADADVTSPASESLTIGNIATVAITDRRTTPWDARTSATLCPGDQLRFGVLATATNGVSAPVDTYQWLQNGVPISGATSATYLTGQAGSYQVSVQQAGCTRLSQTYSVAVSTQMATYANTRFSDRPQCNDNPILLVSDYAGELASVQWAVNGVDIAGATSGTYVASQSGIYSAKVTKTGCSVYVNSLLVTLGRSLLARANLYPSADSVLCTSSPPGSVYLSAENLYNTVIGPGAYTINWYRDGKPTGQNQNLSYFYANQPGNYSFELRQGICVTRSNAIVIKQGMPALPAVLIYSPKTACPGDSRTMYLDGAYTAYYPFQWQKDGVDIPGAANSSYAATTTGSYTVRTAKGTCPLVTLPLSLTFSNALTPVVNIQGDRSGVACSNIWVDARAYTGLAGTQIQWFKDGVAIPGATGTDLNTSQTGFYSVSVTNGSCSGLSKPLLTRPSTTIKPIVQANPVAMCIGNTVRLSASNLSNSQWKLNGVAISGATASSYYPVQSGSYSVYVNGYCGTFESDPVEIKIGELTTAAITGNVLVNSGQTAQLPVAFTGPAPWSFTLNTGQSVQNTYLNPYPLSVTATGTSTYSIVGIENACGTGTSSGQATVTVGSGQADLSVLAQISSRTPRVNDIVSYSLLVTNSGPQDAGNVRVTSRLPVGVEFVEAQSAGVSAAGGVVSGNVPVLLANETAVLTYRLRITQPGTYFTAAQITTTNTPDPDSQPNSGTGDGQDDATFVDLRTADATGGLVASANPNQVPLPRTLDNQPPTSLTAVELSLDMRSSTQTSKAGDVISLSLTVANRGGAVANNIVVQTLLPAGWQLTNATGFVVSGQTVKAYVNQLAVNGKTVLVLPVQVGAGGGQVRSQILEVTEPVSNAIPGNGYQNGERDEAAVLVRAR